MTVNGAVQPAPTPRFSRSSSGEVKPAATAGADSLDVLRNAGLDDAEIDKLIASGAVKQD